MATLQGKKYDTFLAQAEAFSRKYEAAHPNRKADLWWYIGMRYEGKNPVPNVPREEALPGWKWIDGAPVDPKRWAIVSWPPGAEFRSQGNDPEGGVHKQNFGGFWQPIKKPFCESR